MKNLILAAGLLLASFGVHAGDVIKAGQVQGLEYNEVWRKAFSRTIEVWVSEDQMQVTTDSAIPGTFVDFDANIPDRAAEFSGHIAKAIKWAGIAKENKATVVKVIGVVTDRGLVRFSFISEDGDSTLVIDIEDWKNDFKESRILLTRVQQMQELKSIFDNIDRSVEEAQAREDNKELFQ